MRSIASALVRSDAFRPPAQLPKPRRGHFRRSAILAPTSRANPATNGPVAEPSETRGFSTTLNQQNPTVQQQDTSIIKGLPGNKSGPLAKKPERQ